MRGGCLGPNDGAQTNRNGVPCGQWTQACIAPHLSAIRSSLWLIYATVQNKEYNVYIQTSPHSPGPNVNEEALS